MENYTRRTWIQKNIAITAGSGAASALPIAVTSCAESRTDSTKKGSVKLAWALGLDPSRLKPHKKNDEKR